MKKILRNSLLITLLAVFMLSGCGAKAPAQETAAVENGGEAVVSEEETTLETEENTEGETVSDENTVITWNPDDDFLEWDEPRENGKTPLMSMIQMGSADFDVARFKYSEFGIFALDTMNRGFTGNEDPASVEYWEKLGMIKTVHDTDDENHVWALYVPASYYEEGNENRQYPMMFLWHGFMNPILTAEQYGFLEEAAEKEYIVAIPWADNDNDYMEETERLYNMITSEYRVDTSRVYSTGFSLGGQTSLVLGLEKSEWFAAVAGCGTSAGGAFFDENNQLADVPAGHGPITQDDFDQATEKVPVMVIAGDCDVFNLVPVNTEDKMWAVNEWLELEGIEKQQTLENSLELLENSEDEVKRKLGLDFDETQIRSIDGFYYIGRFYNEKGENVFTMATLENGIHVTTRGMARLVFEFFEQHSK